MWRLVTILSENKAPNTCADCGRLARLLSRAYNRFTQSEVRLCPSCVLWHDQQHKQELQQEDEERERASAWRSLLGGAGKRRLRRAC